MNRETNYKFVAQRLVALTDGVPYETANLANASALLENGEEISFRIIVQGNGLSISGVSDNNGINEDYSRLMTTYNPG